MENSNKKAIIHVSNDAESCANDLANFIAKESRLAIESNGIFRVGFSGGSLIKILADQLPFRNVDWLHWKIFFCDERHVAFNDPECTFTLYDKELFNKVDLPKENVFKNEPQLKVEEAAERYENLIKEEFQSDNPSFDMLLLGIGPDGHTCSLFPNHNLLSETNKIVAPISDSPKPPPQRITLTLPVLQKSKFAVFCSCGDGKAKIIKEILENNSSKLPAALVNPENGALHWFLDKPAASLLSNL